MASNTKSFDDYIQNYDELVELYEGQHKATGSIGRTFLNVDTNVSIRSDYNRKDYTYRRRGESTSADRQATIRICMKAYRSVGIVRNVIDLMSDFACQGITLQHPNKSVENFYKRWFKKVNGKDRSERFLNYLYRCGNVIVKRGTGKIKVKDAREWKKSRSNDGLKIEEVQTKKKEIPLSYSFLSPLSIDVLSGDLGTFTGKQIYGLKIPSKLRMEYKHLQKKSEGKKILDAVFDNVPQDIQAAISGNKTHLVLDPAKVKVFHYKKDDWDVWASPMLEAIIDDLKQLEKTRLADLSALDGAISNIRLWKLGYIGKSKEDSILPKRAAITKLRNILHNNVGGGVIDLVWGPELDFKESATSVHQFLGMQKYEFVLSSIYSGLGIPPTLTGSVGGSKGGMTNNFVSMKTLVERLKYGRDILRGFWEEEIEIVRKAMGFRLPAQVNFDQLIMSDESAEKQLLLQLMDRDIISPEFVQDKFGAIPEIEEVRIRRNAKKRGDKIPPKASPFHNPQTKEELKKIIVQQGGVAPSEVGIELEEKKDGEKTPNDDKMEMEKQKNKGTKPEGKPKNESSGRPKKSRDQKPRKPRRDVTRTTTAKEFVSLFMWGNSVQDDIADMVNPALLNSFGKKNLRSLTNQEKARAEYVKFEILCNLEPYQDVTERKVYSILENPKRISASVMSMYEALHKQFINEHGRKPTLDECKQIQSSAYALEHEEE